jgi:hypothetical protein
MNAFNFENNYTASPIFQAMSYEKSVLVYLGQYGILTCQMSLNCLPQSSVERKCDLQNVGLIEIPLFEYMKFQDSLPLPFKVKSDYRNILLTSF